MPRGYCTRGPGGHRARSLHDAQRRGIQTHNNIRKNLVLLIPVCWGGQCSKRQHKRTATYPPRHKTDAACHGDQIAGHTMLQYKGSICIFSRGTFPLPRSIRQPCAPLSPASPEPSAHRSPPPSLTHPHTPPRSSNPTPTQDPRSETPPDSPSA